MSNNNSKIKNKRNKYINNNNNKIFNNSDSISFKCDKNFSFNNLTPIMHNKGTSNESIISIKTPLLTEREVNSKYSNNKISNKIDYEYINYIRTMGNKFTETEKKQEKYFFNNNYGVDLFKIKYKYLAKKFFN